MTTPSQSPPITRSPKEAHSLSPQEQKALNKLRHTELESSLKDSLITALDNGSFDNLAKDINNAKSLEDFENLAQKYGFTNQAQSDESSSEPQESTELAKPEIELSITAFTKAEK